MHYHGECDFQLIRTTKPVLRHVSARNHYEAHSTPPHPLAGSGESTKEKRGTKKGERMRGGKGKEELKKGGEGHFSTLALRVSHFQP